MQSFLQFLAHDTLGIILACEPQPFIHIIQIDHEMRSWRSAAKPPSSNRVADTNETLEEKVVALPLSIRGAKPPVGIGAKRQIPHPSAMSVARRLHYASLESMLMPFRIFVYSKHMLLNL